MIEGSGPSPEVPVFYLSRQPYGIRRLLSSDSRVPVEVEKEDDGIPRGSRLKSETREGGF